MKYIPVIVLVLLVVLGALLISMGVRHGCLPWENPERSPATGLGVEWECR